MQWLKPEQSDKKRRHALATYLNGFPRITCHLLVTTKTPIFANIEEIIVKNRNEEKLFGIKIDKKLSFKNHAWFIG